jgi:predicted DsbA family dithiol-disulfide isomerase
MFPLHPDTPEEGLLLKDLFKNMPMDMDIMINHLKKTASELGLPLCDRDTTYNSRLAQELGLWAETKGRGDEFHDIAFKAYFAHGKNIADTEILLEMTDQAGLNLVDAEMVLKNRSFSDRVDQDWSRSRELGITAVPTFVMNTEKLVGAQNYKALEQLVRANGVIKS